MEHTTLIITAVSAVGGWIFNTFLNANERLLTEKRQRYEKLIESIHGLSDNDSSELGNKFIIEYKLCWMYCPDEIIRKLNDLLSSMKQENNLKQEDKDRLKGELILELRKDLIKTSRYTHLMFIKTNLSASEFQDVRYQPPTKS